MLRSWCATTPSTLSITNIVLSPQKATQTAAVLTSTLLKYNVALKLESILDKEAKITHDMFAAQIEARLGSGEGSSAKGPDMKVWNRGKGLSDVSPLNFVRAQSSQIYCSRSIGNWSNSVIHPSLYLGRASLVTT